MKNILTLIFILMSINFVWGQSLCPPNGITTNPDNPNNPQNSAMENDFFDWRIQNFDNYFTPNFPYPNGDLPPINPYWSTEPYLTYLTGWQGTGLPQSPDVDYSSIEGWELITRGFGRFINGNQNLEFFNPYFLLYNKYSGKMRLLFNIPSAAVTGAFQTVEVHMFFNDITSTDGEGDPVVTGLFSNIGNKTNGGISQPLDQITEITRVIGIANFVTTGWSHVEFDAAFDPCTCMDNSSISFDFYGVESSDALLTGMLLGTATQADLFPTDAFDDDERLLNVLKEGLNPQVGSETYKSIDDWLDAVKRAKNSQQSLLPADFVNNIAQFAGIFSAVGGVITEFPKVKTLLKIKNINVSPSAQAKVQKFGKGLASLGKVAKSSSTLLKEFVNPNSKKTFPSIIEAELALSGEITTTVKEDRATFVIDNPGTSPSTNTNEYGNYQNPSYPFYNEVLGRFALLKTPIVNINNVTDSDTGDEFNPFTWISSTRTFQLDESSIEFVFNPTLNVDLEETTIMGALVVETGEGDLSSSNFLEPTHLINDNNGTSFITPLLLLDCLGGSAGSYDLYYEEGYNTGTSPHPYNDINDQVFLRIVIDYVFNEVDRNGNKNRAMQILTYPVELNETSSTIINEFENITIGELELTGGTFSENISTLGPIIITGDIFAAAGSEIIITGYEIMVEPGVLIGPNVILIPGIPTGCGATLAPSSINLSSYCSDGTYQGNQSSLVSNTPPSSNLSENPSDNPIDKIVLEKEKLVTKVYPNPSMDGMFSLAILSSELEQNITISISDVTGREIYLSQKPILQYDEFPIDLSLQAKGFYFIQITDDLGNQFFEKIIIE